MVLKILKDGTIKLDKYEVKLEELGNYAAVSSSSEASSHPSFKLDAMVPEKSTPF